MGSSHTFGRRISPDETAHSDAYAALLRQNAHTCLQFVHRIQSGEARLYGPKRMDPCNSKIIGSRVRFYRPPRPSGLARSLPFGGHPALNSPQDVERVTEILIDTGFRLIEVPLNSLDPLVSIERIAARFGFRALIAAGTVVSPSDVAHVRNVGGRLTVIPHADRAVVSTAHAQQMSRHAHGGLCSDVGWCRWLKNFPDRAISPFVFKAWRAVFAPRSRCCRLGASRPKPCPSGSGLAPADLAPAAISISRDARSKR